MRKRDWIILGGGLVVLLAVLPFDQRITDWATTPARREIINAILAPILGTSWFFYLAFIFGGYPNRRRLVAVFVTAVLGSALITHLTKQAVGRARPDADMGIASLHEPEWFVQRQISPSFPSGHATTAAALATMLSLVFPRWALAFWIGAAGIGAERIFANRHFLSDVLAGGLVGWATVMACVAAFGRGALWLERNAYESLPPTRWRRVAILGAVWVAAVVVAYRFDASVTAWATAPRVHDVLSMIAGLIGLIVSICFMLALFGTFRNGRRLLGGFAATILVSTAITHLIKFGVGRARPLLEQGAATFLPFSIKANTDAFPSGHTAFALTLAILLGGYYPHARPYFLLVALAVMAERVANAFHFASDLAGGAIVAVLGVVLCRRWLGPGAFVPEQIERRDLGA